MLPVNSKSRLSAQDFLNKVKSSSCLQDWMKTIFSVNGNDFKIAETYKWKGTKPPAWFDIWFQAATNVWHADEWELTTGTLKMMGKGVSMMDADGVSIGKPDPDGDWVNFATFDGNDTGTGGLTVPTETMKNDLNASKDKELHYQGPIVRPLRTGKGRGAIVVVDRLQDEKGQFLPMNANEIAGTLFHELFHAGRISRGEPNAHKDKRFQGAISQVDTAFQHCAL